MLTQGQVVALYNYMSQILVELIKMANMIIQLTKATACAKRIEDVLDTKAAQESSCTALVSKEKRSMDEKTWGHVLVPGPCSLPENTYSIPGECGKKMN